MIEDVFALCFGSVEGDGALVLGAAALPPGVTLLYTPLVRSQVLFAVDTTPLLPRVFHTPIQDFHKRDVSAGRASLAGLHK